MSAMTSATVALAMVIVAPAPAPAPPSFSPGIGYTVSALQREADMPLAKRKASTRPRSSATLLPVFAPPPPGDLARVQSSPRFRGAMAVTAIAIQLGMLAAGLVRASRQADALEQQRRTEVQPYRPYR